MTKILIVPDVKGWAIDQLAQGIMKTNKHHNFKLMYIGPRDAAQVHHQQEFKQAVEEFKPDIIHFMYYRTGTQLIEALPFIKDYKIIISHQNQRTKALRFLDWKSIGVDHLTTATKACKDYLIDEVKQPEDMITTIPYGIDLDYFQYSDKEPEKMTVGYAGRIVPWKGLKEIAEVSKELGYECMFMGRQDKQDYWDTIDQDVRENINFSFMNCADNERLDYYRNLTCYVGFSKDWYEEGTLEYLEAMACGVPVITTPNGLAMDLGQDGRNALIVPFESKLKLKEAVKKIMEDKELRQTLRKNAWNTVKNQTHEKMAYDYSKLYNKVGCPGYELMSVIIPTTYDRIEQLVNILHSMTEQTYPHIEIVVSFDELLTDKFKTVTDDIRSQFPNLCIKTCITDREGYNLAMSRNNAVIESEGKYLTFLDSRLKPNKDALEIFAQNLANSDVMCLKEWFFGEKGGHKESFVENFSAISRKYFVDFGMMNERIIKYGGMSQELRSRWKHQGGSFVYLNNVIATQILGSKTTNQRRKDIIEMKFRLYKLYGNSRD